MPHGAAILLGWMESGHVIDQTAMIKSLRLQDEIKQNKPFSSPAEEVFLALLKTTDMLRRDLSRLMESHGMTAQQYNVLRILRGAGDDGLPTLEIADRMIEETPGITRLIDRLEERSLVSRERSVSDRRQVICRISQAGVDILARLDGPVEVWIREAVALPESDLQQLIGLLAAVRCTKRLVAGTAVRTNEAGSAGPE